MSDRRRGSPKVAQRRTKRAEGRPRGGYLRGVVVLLSLGVFAVFTGFLIGKYIVQTFLNPTPPTQPAIATGEAGTTGQSNPLGVADGGGAGLNGGGAGATESGGPAGNGASMGAPGANGEGQPTPGGGTNGMTEADEPTLPASGGANSTQPILYRVRVGPFEDREAAEPVLGDLQQGEYAQAYFVVGTDGKTYIQVGAFSSRQGAEGVRDSLIATGYPALLIDPTP